MYDNLPALQKDASDKTETGFWFLIASECS